MINRVINLEDAEQWRILQAELAAMKGVVEVTIVKKRKKASREQFGYFFGVVLPIAKRFLNETQGGNEYGDDYADDEADEWLKHYLRGRPVINKKTGEVIGTVVPSKAKFDTKAMAEFVDDVIDLLKKNGYLVPPPDKAYREIARTQRIGEIIRSGQLSSSGWS